MSSPSEITVIDRATGQQRREVVLGEGLLRLAYTSPAAGLFQAILFRHSLCSRLLGWYADSRLSRHRVAPTVDRLGIDMADYAVPNGGYHSFNDFFARRLKPGRRPFPPDPDTVCSPADCRILVFPESDRTAPLPVKGLLFTAAELLGSGARAAAHSARFAGGAAVVARLCPADYHRFHFPFDGSAVDSWEVPGRYDSVNPLALARGARPFARNKRIVTVLRNPRIGDVAFVEVGAFGVGAIHQTHQGTRFAKMDEKGFFSFGGSTIVLVFQPKRFQPDPDLAANSAVGTETLVKAGERIGSAAGMLREP